MYPKTFKKLIDYFSSLPSVGPKMAERLVFYLFKQKNEFLEEFGQLLSELKTDLKYCRVCGHIGEKDICDICEDETREKNRICVVEDPMDVIAIEKTKKYHGLYHVLGGVLEIVSRGKKESLKIGELLKRAANEKTEEIILATNPTTEGDATALYIARVLKTYPKIKITRLARGLSTGSDIEYADEITLSSAIINRK